MINVKCPGCGKTYHVTDDKAGKKAKCPACAAIMEIPSRVEIPPSPREAPGGKEADRTPASVPPMPAVCFNCDRRIGRLEQSRLWQDKVVCSECYARLAKTQPPATQPPQVLVNAPPTTAQELDAKHRAMKSKTFAYTFCIMFLPVTVLTLYIFFKNQPEDKPPSGAAMVGLVIGAVMWAGFSAFIAWIVTMIRSALWWSRQSKHKASEQNIAEPGKRRHTVITWAILLLGVVGLLIMLGLSHTFRRVTRVPPPGGISTPGEIPAPEKPATPRESPTPGEIPAQSQPELSVADFPSYATLATYTDVQKNAWIKSVQGPRFAGSGVVWQVYEENDGYLIFAITQTSDGSLYMFFLRTDSRTAANLNKGDTIAFKGTILQITEIAADSMHSINALKPPDAYWIPCSGSMKVEVQADSLMKVEPPQPPKAQETQSATPTLSQPPPRLTTAPPPVAPPLPVTPQPATPVQAETTPAKEASLIPPDLNDIKSWNVASGSWTQTGAEITGTGDSALDLKQPLPANMTLEFTLNVKSGMRPRVYSMENNLWFGNEGFQKTFFVYGTGIQNISGTPYPYVNNRKYTVSIRFSNANVTLIVDGKTVATGQRSKVVPIRLRIMGGDGFSRGTTGFSGFRVTTEGMPKSPTFNGLP